MNIREPSPSIVLMGVSGCGKTTVGKKLSEALSIPFINGDNFHSNKNIKKMSSGKPLTDADRQSWLLTLSDLINKKGPVILECSALKSFYRRILIRSDPNLVFIFLDISPEIVKKRLISRKNHFMPQSLIQSQFNSLERPENAITIDADQPVYGLQAIGLTSNEYPAETIEEIAGEYLKEILEHNRNLGDEKRMQISETQAHFLQLVIKIHYLLDIG